MSAVQTRKKLSSEKLLEAADKLSASELEKFVSQVITLQAWRRAPCLPEAESELLLKINQGIPAGLQKPYKQLIANKEGEKSFTA
jgi:predicted CopG family antitoxin